MERFPQYLHRPYRILWFETDEIVLMFGGYVFSVLFTVKVLLAVPIALILYRREKRRRPRGFFKQFGYFLGILAFKGYPSAFVRRFSE